MKTKYAQSFLAAFSITLAFAACSGGGGQPKTEATPTEAKPIVDSSDTSTRIEKYAKFVGQPVDKVTATFKEVVFKDKGGVEKKVDLTARLAEGGCCNDREGLQAFFTASFALDETFRDGITALNSLNSRLGMAAALAPVRRSKELVEDGTSNTVEEKTPTVEKDSVDRFMEGFRPIAAMTTLLRGRLVAGADALGFVLSPKFMTDLRDQANFKEVVDKFTAFFVEGAKEDGIQLSPEIVKELAVPIASVSFEADGKFFSFYRFDNRGDTTLATAKDAIATRERSDGFSIRTRGGFAFVEAIENAFIVKGVEEVRGVIERPKAELAPVEDRGEVVKPVVVQPTKEEGGEPEK